MTTARPVPRWRRNLWIAAGALLAFTLLGFFAAPPIIKAQLEKRATAALGRTVTVGHVRVNPFAVSLTLEDLDIRLKDGTGSFLGWRRLYVNVDPLASIIGQWSVGEIELEGFHVTAQLKPDGSFNFSDILARLAPPAGAPSAPAKSGRPLHVGHLKVTEARIDFADQSRARPFQTVLGPASFEVTEFRTAGSRGAPYHFEAVTEAGERLAWTGTLAADPVSSSGELRLDNIVLPKYDAYFADQLRGELGSGKLSLRGRYELNLADQARILKLTEGSVQLRDLKLLEPGVAAPVVEIPALDVTGVTADALRREATIEAIVLSGGHLRVRREADGSINLLTVATPPVAPVPVVPATAATPAGPLPRFRIGEVALKDFQVDFADLAAARPAQLALGSIQFSLRNITLADGAVMPLSLALAWAPQGTVKVDGTVAIRPELHADLKTDVASLALLPLSPYVEQFIHAHITQGAVSFQGAVTLAMAGGQPAVTFDGGLTVERFGLVDGALNEELAGFGSLTLSGLKASTAPGLAVALDEIKVTAPYARVIVAKDQTLNLAGLAKAGPAMPPPSMATEPASAPPAAAPRIEIGRVVIDAGDFSLADRSVEPNVHVAMTQFGGTISGLSSLNFAKATVDLKAAVDGAGPVAIVGQLDPLGAKKFVDLKVDFKNVDLTPLSPYSGKFAGYELARGKLALDVKVQLNDKQLDASNVITLNQFTFGAPVESPDATKLPVRLGVALLKDLNGQIVLDVPMSGSIDDPSLRIGKVVLRVVVNLLTKAAVSPFALLGSMFGGGGDELAYQDFAPGSSALQPAEAAKLATMVKALANRPGLSLALEGGYDGPADGFALKRQKVAMLVRSRIWEERHLAEPNLAPPDQLEITPEASAAMLKKLFDEKFPPDTAFGAPLAAAPTVAAAPPKPKKTFLGKVVDVVTLKAIRGDGAPAETAKAAPVAAAATPAAGPSVEEMTGRLAEAMVVNENDLRALGAARAQRVRDYFLHEGGVAGERLFLAQAHDQKENKGPRVFLSLQ